MEPKDFRCISRGQTSRWMSSVQKPVILLGDDLNLLSCRQPAEMPNGWVTSHLAAKNTHFQATFPSNWPLAQALVRPQHRSNQAENFACRTEFLQMFVLLLLFILLTDSVSLLFITIQLNARYRRTQLFKHKAKYRQLFKALRCNFFLALVDSLRLTYLFIS